MIFIVVSFMALSILMFVEKFYDLKLLRLRWKVSIFVIIFIFSIPSLIEQIEKNKDEIIPAKIYLNLWDYNKKIPLKKDGIVVSPINEIKKDEKVELRFTLTQGNKNIPQITKISISFPRDAGIKTIPWKGWDWEPTNTANKNQYSLNYSSRTQSKGTDYNLPAFIVTFKTIGQLPFEYSIIGDKIEPINKTFVIDTTRKYQQEQSTTTNNVSSGVTVRLNGSSSDTATSDVVSPDSSVIK